jgi:hypothetical protein
MSENDSKDFKDDNGISKTKTCNCCNQVIRQNASVCHHCGRHQNWIVRNLANAGLLITIAMMLIAYGQLREATKQRLAASDALHRASKAEGIATNVASDVTNIQARVKAQEDLISAVAASAIEAKKQLTSVNELANKAQMDVKKVSNVAGQAEAELKKLQSYVRPSIIFDQNGAVLSDQGALGLIEDLKVSMEKSGFVGTIAITLKAPNIFPVLTSLDKTVNYSFNIVQGKKLDVIYELEMRGYSQPRSTTSLFSLEIISGSALQIVPKTLNTQKVMYFPGKIIAEGEFESVKKPGNVRFNSSMGTDPTYQPIDGDTYYDTRVQCYLVFSKGNWRKLLFADEK